MDGQDIKPRVPVASDRLNPSIKQSKSKPEYHSRDRRNRNEASYKCDECYRSFSIRADLLRHSVVHRISGSNLSTVESPPNTRSRRKKDNKENFGRVKEKTELLEDIREIVHAAYSTNKIDGREDSQFHLEWNPRDFMHRQFGDIRVESIGSVVILVEDPLNSQASTCKNYLQAHWPATSYALLEVLDDLVTGKDKSSCILDLASDSRVNGFMVADQLKISVHGDERHTTEIAQQLAFLASALQHSPDNALRVGRSSVVLTTLQKELFFHIPCSTSTPHENESSCWNALFYGAVIADGFPIAERRHMVGLEMPISLMAVLIGAQRAVQYEGGIILKGYSSAFVPLKRDGDSIQWHYIRNDEEVRLTYGAVAARCRGRAMLNEVHMNSLTTTRAFVGWWAATETVLGTASVNYENIDWSDAAQVGRPMTFSGVSLGFQQIVLGEACFSLGARDGKLHMQRKGPYQRIIQCASRTPVVLYDTFEKRAWLVPSSGVILHIAKTRDHRNPYTESEENCFPFADLATSSHFAAEKVLLEAASFKLCSRDSSGDQDYLLQDLVLDIWSYLESLLDKNVSKEAASSPEIRGTFREKLHGWEFMDLVDEKSPFRFKETYIEKVSGAWTDLARDIDAIVLLGSGFEDIIRPKEESSKRLCHSWKSVPKGNDYLTVSVPMMELMYEQAGSKLSRKHLTSTHMQWHHSGLLWDPCVSMTPLSCGCDRLQQVVSSQSAKFGRIRNSGPLEEDGALIFGQSSHPLASTMTEIWKPKDKRSKSIYSQPNVELLGTLASSSPTTDLSFSSASASLASVPTSPVIDNEYRDLESDNKGSPEDTSSNFGAQSGGKARTTNLSGRGSDFLQSHAVSEPPPRRRRREQHEDITVLDEDADERKEMCEEQHPVMPEEDSAFEASRKPLVAKQPHCIRRKERFTKQAEILDENPPTVT